MLGDREVEAYIRSWNLLPSRGGQFEVNINGELVFSKLELSRHAQPGEVKGIIVRKLAATKKEAGY